MAGALGFAIGTGLKYLSNKTQQATAEQQQQHQAGIQLMQQTFQEHPEFAATPQGQKAGKELYGKDWDVASDMLHTVATARQAQQQQLAGVMGMGGGGQQSGNQQAAPNEPKTAEDWAAHIDKLSQFETAHMNEPDFARIKPQIDAEIKRAQYQQTQARMTEQNAASMGERQQVHADAMTNAAATRADTMANAAATHQIAAMTAESNMQMKEFMRKMDEAKLGEDQQKNFDSAKNALQKQFDTINKAVTGTGTTPAMNAAQLKPLLDSYNKQAATLAKRAKAAGVEYDPDEFKPLKAEDIASHPWAGGLGGTTTKLDTADSGSAPLTATNDKGDKIQWDGKAWTPVK